MGRAATASLALVGIVSCVPPAAAQGVAARRDLDEVLGSVQVGEQPLAEWLSTVDVRDCMLDEPEARPALNRLRGWWIRAREESGHQRAARILSRRSASFSREGQQLTDDWLDSRGAAAEAWFCEDDLPLPMTGVPTQEWVDGALALLADESQRLIGNAAPGSSDAEKAATALRDLEDRLRQRFRAQFSTADDPFGADGERLDACLVSFRDDVLDKVSLGWMAGVGEYRWEAPDGVAPEVVAAPFDPTTLPFVGGMIKWFTDKVPEPPDMSPPAPFAWMDYEPPHRVPVVPGDDGLRRGQVGGEPVIPGVSQPPDLVLDIVGGEFLDPWDAAQLAAVVAGWERQTQSVKKEIRSARAAVRDIEAALEDGDLDVVARDAERARRRLARLLQDADDVKRRIQTWSTGKSWIDDRLAENYAPDFYDRLEEGQVVAVEGREQAKATLREAKARGGADPTVGGFGGGGLEGALRASLGDSAVDAQGPSVGGLGLEGEPESTSSTPGAGRLLRYEGPLPSPDPVWSDGIVQRIRAAHRDLDEQDVRILLTMLGSAAQLDSTAVERLVSDWLDVHSRLDLRGGEHTLSTLHEMDDRPDVVFELRIGSD